MDKDEKVITKIAIEVSNQLGKHLSLADYKAAMMYEIGDHYEEIDHDVIVPIVYKGILINYHCIELVLNGNFGLLIRSRKMSEDETIVARSFKRLCEIYNLAGGIVVNFIQDKKSEHKVSITKIVNKNADKKTSFSIISAIPKTPPNKIKKSSLSICGKVRESACHVYQTMGVGYSSEDYISQLIKTLRERISQELNIRRSSLLPVYDEYIKDKILEVRKVDIVIDNLVAICVKAQKTTIPLLDLMTEVTDACEQSSIVEIIGINFNQSAKRNSQDPEIIKFKVSKSDSEDTS